MDVILLHIINPFIKVREKDVFWCIDANKVSLYISVVY